MVKTFITYTNFIFKNERGVKIGSAPFETLELHVEETARDMDRIEMQIVMERTFFGEELKFAGRPAITLGPKRDRPLLVVLDAVGNPDHGQYERIGPKMKVAAADIEEATATVMKYQRAYEMGGGNCSREHGRVYEKGAKRNKLIGRVFYNGKYETLAETKQWEADLKAKYANK